MSTAQQPLKWHGGKSYLAKRIIELMPPHTRYCEPFAGGLAVLFQKPCEGVSEFVNDLNHDLTLFWSTLQHEELFEQFQRIVQAVPLSQAEWVGSDLDDQVPHPRAKWSIVERAVAFFIRYRQSRQGLGKDFCTPTSRTRRGMNENVSAWLSAVDGLPEAHARLRRVEIRNQDACEFIQKLDSPDTLFYCDPPYLHETRHKSATDAYECEMTVEQHQELLRTLGAIQGKFLLSGYPSSIYEGAREVYGWHRIDIEIDNKSSGAKVKAKKIESLWMNY
jgi:DNA adenine methylase